MSEAWGDLLDGLPTPDEASAEAVRARAARVLRPSGALARLDDAAAWLAAWQRTRSPAVEDPVCLVAVADHGVAAEGVSAYPAEVTASMLRALREGAATAGVMAESVGARLEVLDVGVGRPTGNLRVEPALDAIRFHHCLEAGREAVASLGGDLLVLGEMGIGNTTAASAVCASLLGGPPELWVGRGTGLDARGVERKIRVVTEALQHVEQDAHPFEVLSEVGGAELAALAGAALEARRRSIPVVLDGFVVTAAVLALAVARPGALDHCLAGHRSHEPGHRLLLDKLGLRPLLDLELRLGEGSGGLLAVPLLRAAAAAVVHVPTFEEWGLP